MRRLINEKAGEPAFFCYFHVKNNILKKKISRRYNILLRRLNKLIMIGVLSATMLFSNTLVFAADEAASAETQAPETQTSETKTPTPTPEAPNIMDGSDDARKAAESEGIKNSPYATNEELIAHQNIISVKPLTKDFRFTQVEADKAIVKAGSKVYEGKNENSRVVGKAKARSLA